MGSTTAGVARFKREFEAVALPDLKLPPEVGTGLGPVHPDGRGPDRAPRSPAGPAPSLHPVAGPAGLVHPEPHPARRTGPGVRGPRGQPFPPALDLRR